MSLNALEVLQLRAWACAYLWHCDLLSLDDAMSRLVSFAERTNVTKLLGIRSVHSIIESAFREFADDSKL